MFVQESQITSYSSLIRWRYLSVVIMLIITSLSIYAQTDDADEKKSQAIDDVVSYTANDSLVLTGNGTAFLHGKSSLKYKTMDLNSEYIRVKMDSSTIFASGVYDSIGEIGRASCRERV